MIQRDYIFVRLLLNRCREMYFMSLKLEHECDFSLFFVRNCQILTMMLQEFNFPTISLHSMMKQVKLTNFILG